MSKTVREGGNLSSDHSQGGCRTMKCPSVRDGLLRVNDYFGRDSITLRTRGRSGRDRVSIRIECSQRRQSGCAVGVKRYLADSCCLSCAPSGRGASRNTPQNSKFPPTNQLNGKRNFGKPQVDEPRIKFPIYKRMRC